MSAAAETGRTGFAGTADRSTLKLDVRETPNGLRLSLPPLRPPDGCFQQARTGADDPLLPVADFAAKDRSTLELDLRSRRRESQ